MTIGIYALYWEEQDLIYVGQSNNLERRFKEHQYKLNLGVHSNYKVQHCFNNNGTPSFLIIQECSLLELDSLEIVWTQEFNAMDKVRGLSIIEPGISGGKGTNNGNSKYSRIQILKVFSLLYSGQLSAKDIFLRTKVHKTTVEAIMLGYQHTWLKDEYPDKYNLIRLREKNKHKPTLYSKGEVVEYKSPNGVIHTVYSIKDFCVSLNWEGVSLKSMTVNFSKLKAGRCKSYYGWTLH